MVIQYNEWSRRTYTNLAIFVAGYAVIVGTNALYAEPLFEWSLHEIERQQAGLSAAKWDFWAFFSGLGALVVQFVYILFWVLIRPGHPDAVIVLVNLAIEMLVLTAFKVVQRGSRPWWVNGNIRTESCKIDFGNPSAHTVTAAFFTMYLFNRWYVKQPMIEKEASGPLERGAMVKRAEGVTCRRLRMAAAFLIIGVAYLIASVSDTGRR